LDATLEFRDTTTTPTPLLFNGLFSRTTWVSQYQKGKTCLDLNEAKHDVVLGWQWLQLEHVQTICTSLQTDSHTITPTPHHSIFTSRVLFLPTNGVIAEGTSFMVLLLCQYVVSLGRHVLICGNCCVCRN